MSNVAKAKPIVVVAEDSRIQGKVLEQRLVRAGYEVYLGADGQAAFELVKQHKPQVVVSDIEMPKMSGYELCRAIKHDPELRHIPVILLSTLSDAEDIIRGLEVGADNYITKPYESSYLLSRIESVLATPILDSAEAEASSYAPELSVTLNGRTYKVKSGRQQTLNLLISTFENAVEKNRELHRTNEQLILAKEKLTQWNAKLESLNAQLSELNGRMSRDLHAAARIQKSLLPSETVAVPGVAVAWSYTPCEELAGDFLNYCRLDENHLALYVVDVSGHGAASSLLAVAIGRVLTPMISATSLLVRTDSFSGKPVVTPPAVVVGELNRRFQMDSQGGLHFTILYSVLDLRTNVIRYVNAGHPQPVVQSPDSAAKFLAGDGLAVGWYEDIDFDEQAYQLQPGDKLWLYSDGVPEAMDAEMTQLSNERMLATMDENRAQPLSDQLQLLHDAVLKWCQPMGPRDDVSILACEILPPSVSDGETSEG